MTVIDNQLIINNNNNNGNKSDNTTTAADMQIARVSGFDISKTDVKMLSEKEIEFMNYVFQLGQKGKEIALSKPDDSVMTAINMLNTVNLLYRVENCDYSFERYKNGVNLLYNDKIFQHWCKKCNSKLVMTQKDFVDIQIQSKIIKKLIANDEFTMYYPMFLRCVIDVKKIYVYNCTISFDNLYN